MLDSDAFPNGDLKSRKYKKFIPRIVENLGITKHYRNTLIFIILPIFVENLNELIERVPFQVNKCEFCRLYFNKTSFKTFILTKVFLC